MTNNTGQQEKPASIATKINLTDDNASDSHDAGNEAPRAQSNALPKQEASALANNFFQSATFKEIEGTDPGFSSRQYEYLGKLIPRLVAYCAEHGKEGELNSWKEKNSSLEKQLETAISRTKQLQKRLSRYETQSSNNDTGPTNPRKRQRTSDHQEDSPSPSPSSCSSEPGLNDDSSNEDLPSSEKEGA
jgi:hypothetical protein